ncbi:DUF4148 domain-containing protein [Ottowia thiooxydans]|uniref:DUF4148 domain-containing protein n=1 Tax=Ottowia thiooxydans TaxID=219182 RepID=UPI0003FC7EF4|nr:DUF4148 domain-containing protein [Ottowia thiooxydans]
MKKIPSLSISALAIVAGLMAAPNLAHANSPWHQGNGDVVSFTPEHVNAKTREQVVAETNTARADGTLRFYQRGLTPPAKTPVQPKSRQQVLDEMRNQSPEQLRVLNEFYQN